MPWYANRLRFVQRWLIGKPRAIAGAIALMALILFGTVGTAAWFAYDVTSGLPDRKEVHGLGEMAQASIILDAHDRRVFTIFKEQRIEVPYAKMSPNLVKAVVAVEDQRFFEHNGIDLVRIAAAGFRNLRAGRRAQGGSTITQQLARQSFLSLDKTYRRKIKEIILAAHIEREFSKQEILELYLNKVYFGDGLYGVEAASLGYFAKHASDLSIEEAALLAGLIQSPSAYAPTDNPERALARRNVVLAAMHDDGAIDQAQYETARRTRLTLTNGLDVKEPFGLYFKEQVRRELAERFGAARMAQGGLRVYTTIDPELQKTAEKALEDGLVAIEKRRGYRHPVRAKAHGVDYLQGALVSLDPGTGAVRAIVGGRDFAASRFNRATQAHRQAGSAFKPFVYAAALEAGYSPASVIANLNAPIATPQGGWVPEDGHSTAGSMTMRSALKISSNRAAVQLLNTVGISTAVSYARKLNVGTPPSVPSLALGSGDVTLMSLTAAYGAFADEGVLRAPLFIRRVEDQDGKILYRAQGKAERAVSPASAFLMSSMLADVVNAGTAYKARQSGFALPAAGKTGTTNDYVDAWFVGYTPHVVTGVWVGFDRPKTIVANGYAADLAVPIWGTFMKTATKDDKADWFTKPDNVVGVTVCRASGKLPNTGCGSVLSVSEDGFIESRSMLYTDYFVKGTQPTTLCPVHSSTATVPTIPDAASAPFPLAFPRPSPPPAVVATSGVALPPQPVSGGTSPAAAPKPAPKKPGFWGRIFGRGRGGG